LLRREERCLRLFLTCAAGLDISNVPIPQWQWQRNPDASPLFLVRGILL
jgi:hypothetical protein